MSPYRYQLTRSELAVELSVSKETIDRRRHWAQGHYPAWRRVFLYCGLIDLREWQKMIAQYSAYEYRKHEDIHQKLMEEGI